jgi:DNA-binding response OmpR family regulator
MKLLIIEDETGIAHTLQRGLKQFYRLALVKTGRDGLDAADDSHYDAILLDLGLPDLSGLEVCQQLRARGVTSPILILTGESDIRSKVALLDAGANDYLTKPFHLEELKARIRVLVRHDQTKTSTSLVVGEITLDTATHRVERAGRAIALRRKEYELLDFMMRHAGLVVTRTMIMNHIWPVDNELWTNAIDVHIKNLRDKLDRPFDYPYISTIYGLGYKFEIPDSKLVAIPLREEVMQND